MSRYSKNLPYVILELATFFPKSALFELLKPCHIKNKITRAGKDQRNIFFQEIFISIKFMSVLITFILTI
jgi:hypothetical protein